MGGTLSQFANARNKRKKKQGYKTLQHLINGHFRNLNWRYLPYIRPIQGLCKGVSPQNMALYGTVPPF